MSSFVTNGVQAPNFDSKPVIITNTPFEEDGRSLGRASPCIRQSGRSLVPQTD
jgi:hypothetical protein